MPASSKEVAFPWHLGVFDAHCHPTDTLSSLQSIPAMRARALTVMATRAQDQKLVADASDKYGVTRAEAADEELDWSTDHKIIPAFGWHPWFSHQMFEESQYDGRTTLNPEEKAAHYRSVLTPQSENSAFIQGLPDPLPFGDFLSQTKSYLQMLPLALVGEVGLDRSFRIPESWLPEQVDNRDYALTPGGREGRKLSPFRVRMEHQKKVLLAQLVLAAETQRAVSVHGVQAHGTMYETVAQTWKGHEKNAMSRKQKQKEAAAQERNAGVFDPGEEEGEQPGPKPYPPRICLHSFSGPAETVKQYTASSVPCEVYFSFSTTVNAWAEDGNGRVEAAVKAVPDERVLIESDLHTAGNDMDRYLEEGVRKICQIKGWELEDGVKRLGRNWRRFVLGR